MKDPKSHPTSLAQVRKFLQKKYPLIDITRGQGYYYFFSDDDATNAQLQKNAEQGVYVFNCRELTLEQWMEELEQKLLRPEENNWFASEDE